MPAMIVYDGTGATALEFVICEGDRVVTASVRTGYSSTSPVLLADEQPQVAERTMRVRIDFGREAVVSEKYSEDIDVQDVRDFAQARLAGEPVTIVSAATVERTFSVELPADVEAGHVLVANGPNAERGGNLNPTTIADANAVLDAACASP